MKNPLVLIAILIAIVIAVLFLFGEKSTEVERESMVATSSENDGITVHPITHASLVLEWSKLALYSDPVGATEQYAAMLSPDIILITDIHGDHLSTSTLTALAKVGTVIVAPKAVADKLSPALLAQTVVLANGSSTLQKGFSIEAIPMYNLPESNNAAHTKGRGNGYVVEHNGKRVYIAGDTADIPEMRALKNIDTAFIPMNLPYTMTVESAADGVLAFAPKQVYPYHYRGKDGLSDVEKFKQLVNAGNPGIDVVLLDWYPTVK